MKGEGREGLFGEEVEDGVWVEEMRSKGRGKRLSYKGRNV
jgi:hypothetical protein